jgi:hypothetical protein
MRVAHSSAIFLLMSAHDWMIADQYVNAGGAGSAFPGGRPFRFQRFGVLISLSFHDQQIHLPLLSRVLKQRATFGRNPNSICSRAQKYCKSFCRADDPRLRNRSIV